MDSPAHVNCPHCGQQYTVTPEQLAAYTGEAITCTKCGKPFAMAVPTAATGETEPPHAVAAPAAHEPSPDSPSGPSAPAGPSAIHYAGTATDAGHRTSGFSIASLVCGCLLCVPAVPGILAILFAWLGLRQSKRDERVGGKGLAIAGLVLGIVNILFYIGYFILIFALTVPISRSARLSANQAVCRNNLRQIGLAIQNYASANSGQLPPDLQTLVDSGSLMSSTLVCPTVSSSGAGAASTGGATSPDYIYLGAGQSTDVDPDTIIVYERLTNHPTGTHLLTADNLVQFLPTAQAKQALAEQGIEAE